MGMDERRVIRLEYVCQMVRPGTIHYLRQGERRGLSSSNPARVSLCWLAAVRYLRVA